MHVKYCTGSSGYGRKEAPNSAAFHWLHRSDSSYKPRQMERVSSTDHIRNCYFQVLLIRLQNVVLWAEIAHNQHLPHSNFSLVLKV